MAKRPVKDTVEEANEPVKSASPVEREDLDIEKMLDEAEDEDELIALVEKGPEPGDD